MFRITSTVPTYEKALDIILELELKIEAYGVLDKTTKNQIKSLKEFVEYHKTDDNFEEEDTFDIDEALLNFSGQSKEDVSEKVLNILKSHAQVQAHPDTFHYAEIPERLMITLDYKAKTHDIFGSDKTDFKKNNQEYNLCKRFLGLPEYMEK